MINSRRKELNGLPYGRSPSCYMKDCWREGKFENVTKLLRSLIYLKAAPI